MARILDERDVESLTVDWKNIQGKPNTLLEYGIKSISKSDLDSDIQNSLNKADSAIQSIPSAIKNPNSLIFSGAVSASYDGSSVVTIEIPETGIQNLYMRIENGYLQYSVDNISWNNLIEISTITNDKTMKVDNDGFIYFG